MAYAGIFLTQLAQADVPSEQFAQFSEAIAVSGRNPMAATDARGRDPIAVSQDRFYQVQMAEEMDPLERLEAKYRYFGWQEFAGEDLINRIVLSSGGPANEAMFVWGMDRLDRLRPFIDQAQIASLIGALNKISQPLATTRQQLAMLLANYGDSEFVSRAWLKINGGDKAVRRAGPRPISKPVPYFGRNYFLPGTYYVKGFDESFYDMTGEHSLFFRGLHFQVGDVLIADLNRTDEGLLEGFSDPRPYGRHCGLFVMVLNPRDNKRYPMVLEIHERGDRLVPLAQWLSRKFVHHAHVRRFRDVTPKMQSDLSSVVWKMIQVPKSYDFQGRDRSEGDITVDEMTCTTLIQTALVAAGFPVKYVTSKMRSHAIEQLKKAGLKPVSDVFSPTNFLFDLGLDHAGVVYNGDLITMLASESVVGHADVEGSLSYSLAHHDIALENLGRKVIREMRLARVGQMKYLGKPARLAVGFHPNQVPKAAAKVIGIMVAFEQETATVVNEMINRCRDKILEAAGAPLEVSLAALENDPQIRASVREIIAKSRFGNWFSVPPPPSNGEAVPSPVLVE